MSVLIWVSNGDVQRSNRICSQDQHAQAQHWLRQAQLMHAQHWPRTQSRSRQGGGCPPLPCSHLGPRPMLSMHELSLPEPMLSLSMLILATCPERAQKCSEHCSEHDFVRNVWNVWNVPNTFGTFGTMFGSNIVRSQQQISSQREFGTESAPSWP